MRPSDRTIRDELRREAARVQIPNDMWENISRRLDEEPAPVERPRKAALLRPAQWRPALAVAAAAGLFWFTMLPTHPASVIGVPAAESPAQTVSNSDPANPAIPAEELRPDNNRARREQKRTVSYVSAVQDRGLGVASMPNMMTQR